MSKARNLRRRAEAKAVKLLLKLTPEQRAELIERLKKDGQ
jgi:hypothetical protein